uniref:thioredoxin-dependent peroxiredoxin n=1 Tax=Phaffia rhodozyma TaxID=264483 RepID=A0A1L1YP48_PHARH|nr:Xd2CPrx-iso [Phaffia rhodozyma]
MLRQSALRSFTSALKGMPTRSVVASRLPMIQPAFRSIASSAVNRSDRLFDGLQEYNYPGRAFVQAPAPEFKGTVVEKGEFKEVSLSDYKGKYLVLLFYPMDFTFVCPTEILSFDRALSKFRELNTEVLAISTDSEYSHLAWANLPRQQGGLGPDLSIPMFADRNHEMSSDYGVLLREGGIALRGLFIIDPEGIVRQITINDLPVGRSVEETIRLIQAFQFNAEHGEVCPSGWSPENPESIDPKDAMAYFKKQ